METTQSNFVEFFRHALDALSLKEVYSGDRILIARERFLFLRCFQLKDEVIATVLCKPNIQGRGQLVIASDHELVRKLVERVKKQYPDCQIGILPARPHCPC